MPRQPLPPYYENLDLARDAAWDLLMSAARDRHSQMHLVTLATLGPDATPEARTVVLRGVDPIGRRLRIHSDRRSLKVREIAANPAVAVLAYNPEAKVQVRLSGTASVQDDATAELWWRTSKPMSRECYRAPFAPGTTLPSPRAGDLPPPTGETVSLSGEHTQPGRENFVVLSIVCRRFDWLFLASEGHRRARFDWDGRSWRGLWVGP